ncbi:translation initiation factor IF-2 [Paramuribaculum intestinale]|uniref:translation initiation factor IF-2 n=1 Tax=Paramuribaculum intestinale TaxID=2094151 RepID=UPI000F48E716|nr:translation initiation factor IF-2 [Paramuribaculum intestinale]ROT16756.1 translation initiation factor IF-2 [Muribaculaceae bacterium Isolate-105 (HZI)]
MARTKISKIARDFNVALPTLIDFLRKKGITIEDNPNARVDDSVLDIIVKEYQTDRVQKTKSDNLSGDRHGKTKERQPEQRQAPEIKIEAPVQQGPKVVGHIDLDSRKPVVTSPSAEVAEEPVKSAPVEQSNAVAEPAAENKSAEPVASVTEKKPEAEPAKVEPETKPEEPAKPEPVATAKVAAEEVDKTEAKPEAKAEAAAPAEESGKEAAASETDGVFSPNARPTLNINVVGKIDLSAINQSTRPRRKSKEEKRNDRIAAGRQGQGAAAGGTAAAGDRKKRKRIGGKEKIDIEKTAQQSAQNGGGQRQNQQKGDRDRQRGRDRQRHGSQSHSEVTEEDVQRQVKETLARLTNKDKGLKKSAKWRKEKKEINAEREREAHELEAAESRVLKLTEFVTANDLASLMDVPVNKVIGTCMSLGVMVSINQRLDAETINIVAEEFGFETEYVSAEVVEAINQEEDSEDQLVSRPPIVTVMGHVDHGKTSLLDYIRKANVIAGEAGGITQHIGAYNVKLADGRHITFLDTPGHEAFTAMRARGAKVTDICIIIVAADDNVMPQTIEAINHASAAGVPIVFAINKIDKPAANPDKVKEELANMNYLVEEWGGKYQSQDISAKKGIGVEELMEKVLLEAEMLDLKANPDRRATGSIIESSLDKGRGYVATVLVQNGTLRVGDVILAGTHFGRIKAMFNERNQRIKEAGPSEPALILGLNGAPTAGDTFNVMEAESEAREIANKREQLQREQGARTKKILTLEDIGRRRAIGNFQELNIIVKGDVDGSIEALSDSLIKLSTEEIQVNVLHKAVGEISESDVTLAAASDAIIIGFQVRPSQAARREAEREGVQIRLYSVIYQAIEEVKDAMEGMLAPEIKEEVIGTAEVLQTYKISKVGTVAGCIVREGKLKRSCKVRVIRGGIVRHTGELDSLKRFKDDVKEVLSGYDCGLNLHNYNDLQEGDMIEAFEEVEVKKTL